MIYAVVALGVYGVCATAAASALNRVGAWFEKELAWQRGETDFWKDAYREATNGEGAE